MCSSACARSHERDLASVSRHARPTRAETEPCTDRDRAHLALGLHAQTHTKTPEKVLRPSTRGATFAHPCEPAHRFEASNHGAGCGGKMFTFLMLLLA